MKTPEKIMEHLKRNTLVLASVPHGIKHHAYVDTLMFFYNTLKEDTPFKEWQVAGIEEALDFLRETTTEEQERIEKLK